MRLRIGVLRQRVKANLPIEFVPQRLTSYGGLELIRRYFRGLDLRRRADEALAAAGVRSGCASSSSCAPAAWPASATVRCSACPERRHRDPLRTRRPCPRRVNCFRIRANSRPKQNQRRSPGRRSQAPPTRNYLPLARDPSIFVCISAWCCHPAWLPEAC